MRASMAKRERVRAEMSVLIRGLTHELAGDVPRDVGRTAAQIIPLTRPIRPDRDTSEPELSNEVRAC